MSRTTSSAAEFASLVQAFFCDRLMNQQDVSTRTVAAYRDTFRLLFGFIEKRHGCTPSDVTLGRLDADLILEFLRYLENERGNCVRTRNARLAAIRSFFQYVATETPEQLAQTNRVLAIPMKRYDRPAVRFLSKDEMDAIIRAPDSHTWTGRRDIAMFTTLYNTGARVSELTRICLEDLNLTGTPTVALHGKGRKQRTIPLWKTTGRLLKTWKREIPDTPKTPLFPDSRGTTLSRSGVEYRLRRSVQVATGRCPSLTGRSIHPHLIRHTTAMHMLHSGVDIAVIALWLGHESIQTTHMYMEADLRAKEKALACLQPPSVTQVRFKADDRLLRFLESL
ncbi:MAG: site-specific integrase [Spirochaetales bacterium]|nr:site-specific integrase [Spirochaetales bacterium]